MMPLFDYWLKANLFLLLFYGCYTLLLRRHTFLGLNRTYLMGSLVLALLLPLVHIPGLSFPWPWETDVPVYATVSADTITVVGMATETKAPLLPDWPVLAAWAFALVAAGLLLRTGWRTFSLLRLIRQWPAEPLEDHTLVLPDNAQTPTFSFFSYLVLNPDDAQTEAVRQHELVHIRQRHSLDIVLLEVIHALCWLNPVLFGYRQAIRQVHEYLADRDATPQTPAHREAYARFLVSYAFHLPTNSNSLAHSFGPDRPDSPTLKQRIQMLYQQHTRRRALWKYALVLPLATALLALTNKPETPVIESELESKLKTTNETAVASSSLVHVQGVVCDKTGSDPAVKPLPGANVAVRNGHQGTTTDAKGMFTIDVPAGTELVASFVGFETQSMTVPSVTKGHSIVLSFKLQPTTMDGTAMPVVETPTSTTVPPSSGGNEVFMLVEQPPVYPGGMAKLYDFLSRNIRYPEEAKQKKIQGKVFVSFVVNTDGSIDRIRVLKGIGAGCDEEAVRVMSVMPNWIPGKQSGRPVAVQYNLPIDFKLSDKVGLNQSPSSETRVGYSAMDSMIAPMSTTFQMTDRVRLPGDNEKALTFELYDRDKNVVYILDGREISKAEMSKLNPASIQSMTVLKNEFKPTFYNGKAVDGVIRITSKKVDKVGTWPQPALNLSTPETDAFVKSSPKIYHNSKIVVSGQPRLDKLNPPLYLLDGEEITDTGMNVIDPETIGRVDVLKGVSAATYGERGRNGVVIITTKKGSQSEKKKDR